MDSAMDVLMLGYNEDVPAKWGSLLVDSGVPHNYIATYCPFKEEYMLQWTNDTCDMWFVGRDDPSMDVHLSRAREGSRKELVKPKKTGTFLEHIPIRKNLDFMKYAYYLS